MVRMRRERNWRVPGLLLLILAVGLAAWTALGRRGPAVPAVQLQAGPLVRSLLFSARVSTQTRVDLGATVTGRVRQVLVREGDAVKAGAPLLRLESDEAEAALRQALASERQAEARVAGLRGSGRGSARAGLQQAEANLRAAQADLTRTEDLVAQGFLSPARLDESRRAVAVARAQADAARTAAEALGDAGTDLAQAQAQLDLARAGVAAARSRLAQTVLAAPADARVLDRQAEPGQIVQPGRALLSLALSGPLELVAPVDERYLEQLRPGQPAHVVADAFPERRFQARVQSIAPLVDAQRGAVEVRLAVQPPVPEVLREDMTLSVEVETGRRERALTVPVAALRPAADGSTAVLVVRDGRAVEQRVTLGLRTLQAAEVSSGLQAGDVVLLASTLAPGSAVRPDLDAGRALASRGGKAEDAGSAVMNAMGR